MQHKHSKQVLAFGNKGAAALVTVIVVSVAALIMATTAARLGIGELDVGFTASSGSEAFAVADGCMEETLRRIRLDTNYGVGAGTISLTTDNGSCTIDVTSTGSTRQITVKGTHDVYHAKIRSDISLSGNVISVTSWSERSD